jgi:uncharacterized protein YndB with AHSA1/START domain
MTTAAPTQTYELFIRATPERAWQAITDGALTQQYFFGSALKADLRPGGAFAYSFPDGSVGVDGTITEVAPNQRLAHTWRIQYDPTCAGETSKVTWTLEPRGENVKLTLVHELANAPASAKSVGNDGWSLVLSSMKSLLETGSALHFPMQG